MHLFDWNNFTWDNIKFLVVILAFVPIAYLLKFLFDLLEKYADRKAKSDPSDGDQ